MENLAPEYREQALQQMEKAFREGKPLPSKIVLGQESIGKLSPPKVLVLTLLILGGLFLTYLLSLR